MFIIYTFSFQETKQKIKEDKKNVILKMFNYKFQTKFRKIKQFKSINFKNRRQIFKVYF